MIKLVCFLERAHGVDPTMMSSRLIDTQLGNSVIGEVISCLGHRARAGKVNYYAITNAVMLHGCWLQMVIRRAEYSSGRRKTYRINKLIKFSRNYRIPLANELQLIPSSGPNQDSWT